MKYSFLQKKDSSKRKVDAPLLLLRCNIRRFDGSVIISFLQKSVSKFYLSQNVHHALQKHIIIEIN